MGRGNWFPGNDLSACELVYADLYDDAAEFDEDLAMWQYEDFKECLFSFLPKSFHVLGRKENGPRDLRCQGGRDDVLLAYNQLYALWVDAQSDTSHVGIGFTVINDAPAFAASKLPYMAERVFDKLGQCYPLYVRTSPWTSAPYRVTPMRVSDEG